MKTIIRTSTISTTGYELVIIDEQGNETVHVLNDKPKNEPYTLILPTNPSNRKYFSSKKVDEAGGEIELAYKESRTLGSRAETSPRKQLHEYLSDDEQALFLSLLEKAKMNREQEQKKVMTPEEKLKARIARLQAEYDSKFGGV